MGNKLKRFAKIFLLMFFTYAIVSIALDLLLNGWLDLRKSALLDMLFIPLGQAVVFYLVTAPFQAKKNMELE